MPKGIPKQNEEIKTLVEMVSSLANDVKSLKEKIEEQPKQEAVKYNPSNTIDELFPMPIEYRGIVNEVLNKDFEIRIEYMGSSPSFQFTIIVPEKYSNISDAYRQMYHGDIRPRIIQNSIGAVGVRQWAETVFNSFNPTIQAQVVADRHNLVTA